MSHVPCLNFLFIFTPYSWPYQHVSHPYPNSQEKVVLSTATGLSVKQINCWFTNNRKRLWRKELIDPVAPQQVSYSIDGVGSIGAPLMTDMAQVAHAQAAHAQAAHSQAAHAQSALAANMTTAYLPARNSITGATGVQQAQLSNAQPVWAQGGNGTYAHFEAAAQQMLKQQQQMQQMILGMQHSSAPPGQGQYASQQFPNNLSQIGPSMLFEDGRELQQQQQQQLQQQQLDPQHAANRSKTLQMQFQIQQQQMQIQRAGQMNFNGYNIQGLPVPVQMQIQQQMGMQNQQMQDAHNYQQAMQQAMYAQQVLQQQMNAQKGQPPVPAGVGGGGRSNEGGGKRLKVSAEELTVLGAGAMTAPLVSTSSSSRASPSASPKFLGEVVDETKKNAQAKRIVDGEEGIFASTPPPALGLELLPTTTVAKVAGVVSIAHSNQAGGARGGRKSARVSKPGPKGRWTFDAEEDESFSDEEYTGDEI